MNQQNSLTVRLELMWWGFTAIVVAGFLFPILNKVTNYPFLMTNVVFIIVFVTFARYIFLLQHTFLAQRQALKVIIFFLCVPLLFYLINQVNFFQTHLDENGMETLVGSVPYIEQQGLYTYIRTQMFFFGAGSIVVAILFPLRLLLSFWRWRNRGTV